MHSKSLHLRDIF